MADVTTVAQLLRFLLDFPGETPVVLSSDAEGNRYSCLSSADSTLISAEDVGDWDIEIFVPQDIVDDPANEYDPEEDSPPGDAVTAVVLIPVN